MMNTKKYLLWKIVLPIIIIALFISCTEEFFNTEIGGRIDPSDHYKSRIDADMSYLGCFVYLQDIAEKRVLVDGLRSDMMNVTDNADADMIAINHHEITANNPYIDPASYYKLIININEVLPKLPQILELDRDFDSLLLRGYEGALVTMRCWAYYNLAKINGEVGIVEGDLIGVDPSKPPVYMNKGQIIVQLLGELLQYDDPKDIFRYPIDHYVLIGELFLELQDYPNAVKYFKFAVDGPSIRGKNYKVSDDYEEDGWQLMFIDSDAQGGSVYTAVPYSFRDGQKNSLEEWMNIDFSYMVKPSDTIVSLFKNEIAQNDDIGDLYRGVGVTYDTSSTGMPFIHKYSLDENLPHSADVILYRDADVHLMMAEALNRMGNSDLALVLLNNGIGGMPGGDRPSGYSRWSGNRGVRGRVYLKERTVPGSVVNVTEYVEDLIIEERAKELAFEGKRWDDLVRIAIRRNDPSYLADKVAAKFDDPDMAEAIRTKLMDEANWYIPLAKVE